MPGPPATYIAAVCRHSAAHAAAVAHELGLQLADASALARGPAPYLLCESLSQGPPRISIRIPRGADPSFAREAGVSTDVAALMRRKRYSRLDPLLRSVGPVKKTRPSFVIDATAGLGEDALMLANGGHFVAMVERCPAVFATLRNGIERARSSAAPSVAPALHRVCVLHADSVDALRWMGAGRGGSPWAADLLSSSVATCSEASQWARAADVDGAGARRGMSTFSISTDALTRPALPAPAGPQAVFLDPMYPTLARAGAGGGRRSRAAQRKEMVALRLLAGPDEDADELVTEAMNCVAARTVVKGPAAGTRSLPRQPDAVHRESSTIFSVFFPPRRHISA